MGKASIAFLAGLAGGAFVMSSPASAQSICAPHKEVIERLEGKYKEAQAGIGLAANGDGVVQLYVSESGSWTVLVTQPTGLTCLVAGGQSWEIITPNHIDANEDLS